MALPDRQFTGEKVELSLPLSMVNPRVELPAVAWPSNEIDLNADSTTPEQHHQVIGDSTTDRQQRAQYADGLYKALARSPRMPIPDKHVGRILRHFDGWDYKVEGEYPRVSFLIRQAVDSSVELHFSQPPTPTHNIRRDEKSLTIRAENDHIRGWDFMTLIEIERQYPTKRSRNLEVNATQDKDDQSSAAIKYRESAGVLYKDEVLTDTEAVVLSCMTYCSSRKILAEELEVQIAELRDKILYPLCDKFRIKKIKKSSPDTYIELMLVGISLGVANVDHVQKAFQSELDDLTESDSEVLKYYSSDPEDRKAFRAKYTEDALTKRWSNLYKKLNVDDRHEAVLYAVNNGILQPPDTSKIRRLAQQTTGNVK
jgi:hypothetical protein